MFSNDLQRESMKTDTVETLFKSFYQHLAFIRLHLPRER